VVPVMDLARKMRQRGVDWAVYTDIARDGMMSGVDASATASLARRADCGSSLPAEWPRFRTSVL